MKHSHWLTLTALCYPALVVVIALQAMNTEEWLDGGLMALPLLAFLPGVLASHHRAYTWLCFVVLVYFCFYIMQVSFQLSEGLMWAGLVASIGLFIGAMMTGRGLQK